jgi:hypothetical protein
LFERKKNQRGFYSAQENGFPTHSDGHGFLEDAINSDILTLPTPGLSFSDLSIIL